MATLRWPIPTKRTIPGSGRLTTSLYCVLTWLICCRKDRKIWSGKFVWRKRFEFECSLLALSNEKAFDLTEELPQKLTVIGKIDPDTVWTYIAQLQGSNTKDVILLLVQPGAAAG